MPPKSSIRKLPPEVRQVVDRLLLEGQSARDIAAHLETLGATVSKSAVHRYSQDQEELLAEMRQANESMQIFAREIGDLVNENTFAGLFEMLRAIIFKAQSTGLRNGLEPKEVSMLARAFKDAVTGQEKVVELRTRIERDVREQVAADLEAAGDKGIDLAEFRASILLGS